MRPRPSCWTPTRFTRASHSELGCRDTQGPEFRKPVNPGYSYRMAQKPVANALTLELEPVVEAELRRHLDTEDLWYAHDYVPFDQGENFAFLGGQDWDPS